MALVTGLEIPGPCTISYGGASMGVTKRGIAVGTRVFMQPVRCQKYGIVDYIYLGKALTLSCHCPQVDGVKAAYPYPGGKPFSLYNSAGTSLKIGQLLQDKDGNVLGDSVTITESDASTWVAPHAVWTAGEPIRLSATQEVVIPMTFVLAPDPTTKKYFSTKPAYVGG